MENSFDIERDKRGWILEGENFQSRKVDK